MQGWGMRQEVVQRSRKWLGQRILQEAGWWEHSCQEGQGFSGGPALHKYPSTEGAAIPPLSENAGGKIRLPSPSFSLLSCISAGSLPWLPGVFPVKSKLHVQPLDEWFSPCLSSPSPGTSVLASPSPPVCSFPDTFPSAAVSNSSVCPTWTQESIF